jgi:hypothetical protein
VKKTKNFTKVGVICICMIIACLFQERNGLDQKGVVGLDTLGALNASSGSVSSGGISKSYQGEENTDLYVKATRGEYYKEYVKAVQDSAEIGSGMPALMYGKDPVQQYQVFVYNPGEISLEDYINTMGPQWEMERRGRTL